MPDATVILAVPRGSATRTREPWRRYIDGLRQKFREHISKLDHATFWYRALEFSAYIS